MKKIFTIFVFTILVVSTMFVIGAVRVEKNPHDVVNLNGHAQVFVPDQAKEVVPGVFSLGHAIDVDGRVVEGLMFVHSKKENARPSGKGKKTGGSTCYSYLVNGAKWKTVEDYLVDPTNARGLDEVGVKSILSGAISEWETAADFNILGNEVTEVVNRTNIGNLNGKNEVIFADIDGTNIIGVTIVWGIFGGNPNTRELVEWDQVYDDVSFDWSLNGSAEKMDFENIAQHELGHSVGMGHAPTDSGCMEETMYPTAGFGETKKRTLNAGDQEGILSLY